MRAVAFGIGLAAALGVASVMAAGSEDTDAPVATARYAVAVDDRGPPPQAAPEATSSPGFSSPAAPALPAPPVAAPDTVKPSSAVIAMAVRPQLPARGVKRFDIALDDARGDVDAVAGTLTGLATNVRLRQEAAAEVARLATPVGRIAQDRNLRRGFGEMRATAEKARLFLFAGDRGGVWTYNFTHDGSGVKAAGWAKERADMDGEQRIGVAWQKGPARVALVGMERKFCQLGAQMKDRVVAMTLSFSPGWSTKPDRKSSWASAS